MCLCREYRGHGPQPVRPAGLPAGPHNNTQLVSVNCDSEVYFVLLRRWHHPARLGLKHTLRRAIRPFSFVNFCAFRRGDVPPGHSDAQDLRRDLPGRRLDPQPVRPRRAPVRGQRPGLGPLVHCRHLLRSTGLPPLLRGGTVRRLYPAVPDAGGLHRLRPLPAGLGQEHHLALGLRPLLPGCGPDLGSGRGGRRLRPLLLPPVLLPGAGRLCRVLHVVPAEHGLCDGGGRGLPADEPVGGGTASTSGPGRRSPCSPGSW